MLLPGSELLNTPVMSLQTGAELARSAQAVINPDNLFIVAYELEGVNLPKSPMFLRVEDIREIGDYGFIIDAHDELVELDDIITLKRLYESNFEIINLPVVDENGQKLGKVADIIINPASFIIQQIAVRRPFFKSLNDTELRIHRNQIVSVSKERLVVRQAAVKNATGIKERYSYANPFRKDSVPHAESQSHGTTRQSTSD